MKVKAKIEIEVDLEFSQDSLDDYSMYVTAENESKLLEKYVTNRAVNGLIVRQCMFEGIHEFKMNFTINSDQTKILETEDF
jgi:hypothetical protein